MSDFFLEIMCFSTSYAVWKRAKFAYLSGVTLGGLFIFMAVLAVYTDLTSTESEEPTNPLFLNAWFVGWGSFLIFYMHNWKTYWTETGRSGLPTKAPVRKSAAI